jgi:hypothetical protein
MTPELVHVQFLNAPIPLMLKSSQHQQSRASRVDPASDDRARKSIATRGSSATSSSRPCHPAQRQLKKRSNGAMLISTLRSTPPAAGPAALEMRETLRQPTNSPAG